VPGAVDDGVPTPGPGRAGLTWCIGRHPGPT